MQSLEHLYAFMDGELDPVFEKQLFSELTINEDLRSEMKDLLSMREAVRRDVVVPSLFVKDRLLTTVGLAGTSAAITTGMWPTVRNAFSGWAAPVLGVLVGVGATALALISYQPINDYHTSAQSLAAQTDIPNLTLVLPRENSAPIFSANHLSKSSKHYSNLRSASVASLSSENGRLSTKENDLSENNDINSQEIIESDRSAIASNVNVISDQVSVADNSAQPKTSKIHAERDNAAINADDSWQGVSIRARGLFNRSFPVSNINAESNSWINNAAFGALFKFNSCFAAGVEIGMERFAQVFGSAEGASEVWYEQNPQMLWAGALVQYKLLQLDRNMDVHLYGETFAGAAGTLGFLGRQTVGLNVTPTPALTISAGAEAAILPYNFKGNWFSTEKFGFTLGLSFTPEGLR